MELKFGFFSEVYGVDDNGEVTKEEEFPDGEEFLLEGLSKDSNIPVETSTHR